MGRSKVAVSQSLLEDRIGDLPVQSQALGLLIFLIPSKIEPTQAFEDGVDGGVGVALDIGVVEAKNHRSSVVAGVKPVENEGAGAANMQKAGRGRGESNTKHNV